MAYTKNLMSDTDNRKLKDIHNAQEENIAEAFATLVKTYTITNVLSDGAGQIVVPAAITPDNAIILSVVLLNMDNREKHTVIYAGCYMFSDKSRYILKYSSQTGGGANATRFDVEVHYIEK